MQDLDAATILIVDQDAVDARRRLESAGYDVVVATTATEALVRARTGGIDLAVVNFHLEESFTGLDLFEQFTSSGLALPVIIVTGRGEEGTVIKALRAGVSDFVSKSAAYLDYLPEAASRAIQQDRTEKRLAESEARFISFMDNNPGLTHIKDEEGRFLFANRLLKGLFPQIDTWEGKTVFDIVPADLVQRILEDDLTVLRSGETTERLYTMQLPDGTPRFWLSYSFPIHDINGHRILGGVTVDVSERMQAEEALRSSEAKFRSVSEAATDAIVAIDQYGCVISWNSAAARMFGYTAREMLGQSLERIVPPRYREAQSAALSRLLTYGEKALSEHPRELYGLRRDGAEFPIEMSIGSWTQGGELFFSSVIRDLTERRRAAEELRKRDEQLRHSQKLEALGTLAGGVAHEFNNLLQSIQGYTSYAMDGLDPDDTRRCDLELVLKATQRAAMLTRQLLGFSRREMLQYSDLDPNQVVRDAARLLRPLIGEHIQLELSLDESVGTIHADAAHLQQLLMNLCVNARDAMPDGGQLLIKTEPVVLDDQSVTTYPSLVPGRYLLLTISDNGCGMSKDVLEHAFDPFYTTKDVGQGTGLGLSAVYGVVTQHKGTVRVYSEPGVGTSVKVLLPVIEAPVERDAKVQVMPRARPCETILVAEDEPLVRDLVIRALESAGYQTIHADDGAQRCEPSSRDLTKSHWRSSTW